jgi:hypothetical protein
VWEALSEHYRTDTEAFTSSATAFRPVIAQPTPINRLPTVAPTGGTGTYTYSYDNGGSLDQAQQLFNDNGYTNLPNYSKDANGCLSPVQTIVYSL